jgi:pyruvate dehydrogenase E2 component (dihydrolipoamide acetyltransferase)
MIEGEKMVENIVVPEIGEGVESGKVVAVQVKPGDAVKVDDTIVELETDKAVVEIPSTVSGRVTDVLVKEGDDVKIGAVIAKVETEGGDADTPPEAAASPEADPAQTEAEEADTAKAESAAGRQLSEETEATDPSADSRQEAQKEVRREDKPEPEPAATETRSAVPVPASPSIRRMARELGVDIAQVDGSGPGGRISETDIKAFVKAERQAAAGAGPVIPSGAPALPDFSRWGEIEAVELETVRRLTAESTATSWHAVPHVTQFDKADITVLETFIQKNAPQVATAGGKLTVTAILTKVCAEALKRYPRFNTSLDLQGGRLITKKYIHIGIAVDTPRGLFMPVIANADTKSISQLSVDIVDLAQRARNKKIKPSELEGGTFSISNQGGIGGVGFTPIVLWPQVAILGVSRAAVEPVAVDGQFVPRKMLPLSLSYDHRVIDGADAARFLRWVCECLEQPMTLHLD